jgi:hypothetical protein
LSSPRSISFILAALVFAGCTRAVDVPLYQFEAEAQSHESHRFTMKDNTQYVVDQFAISDSTVTIMKWNLADTRYKHVELPVVLNRRDVKFVEKLELDQGKSFYVVAPIGLAVLLIIGLATSPIHID